MLPWFWMGLLGVLSASASDALIDDGYGHFSLEGALLDFEIAPEGTEPVVLWPPAVPVSSGTLRMQLWLRGAEPSRMTQSRQVDVFWEKGPVLASGTRKWQFDVVPRAGSLSVEHEIQDHPEAMAPQRIAVSIDAQGAPTRVSSDGDSMTPGADLISQALTQLRPELPTEAIAPGHTWETEQSMAMPLPDPSMGTLDLRRSGRWLYRGRAEVAGRDCAVITGEIEGVLDASMSLRGMPRPEPARPADLPGATPRAPIALEEPAPVYEDEVARMFGITRSAGVVYLDLSTAEVVYGVQTLAMTLDGDGIPQIRVIGRMVVQQDLGDRLALPE